MVPVRFGVYGGYQSGASSFEADKKSITISDYAAGLDFQVPIGAIRFTLGMTGSIIIPSAKSDNGFMLFAPFLGYSHNGFEFLLGGGIAGVVNERSGTDVAPNQKVRLESNNMGCGFAGTRLYVSERTALGIGVNSYFCKASSYEKVTTDSGGIKTTTKVSSPASESGVVAFLILSWGESRQIH